MQWRLRRLLRRTDRRLRAAASQADMVSEFERFTDEIAHLRDRRGSRLKRRGMSYLP